MFSHRPAFVEVPAGWTIALGDKDDRHVTSSHYWQSDYLVFSDGRAWPTKINTAERSGRGVDPEWPHHLDREGTKVCIHDRDFRGDLLLFKTA